MKKQILSIALAGMLAMSMTVPAFAVDTGFQDVPVDAWYAKDVLAVQDLGIIQGKGNNIFDPNGLLTVAEAITMAAKTRAWYNGDEIPVVEGKWYAGAVQYAKENGVLADWITAAYILKPMEAYNPSANRGVMAYLFAYALPSSEYNAINRVDELPDVHISTQYQGEILALYNAGILSGLDEYGTFKGGISITRAEAAAILNRVVNKENRLVLSLKENPVVKNDGKVTARETPMTLRWDDPSRPYAREGDTFIAKDGKSYKLTVDAKTGVVGVGLPIAVDLGRVDRGQTVTDGGYVTDLSRPEISGNQYQVNHITGEGHFNEAWGAIMREYYPNYEGKKDGELSKDKNFIWSDIIGGWGLVVDNQN